MTALPASLASTAPDDQGAAFAAIGDAMAIAATYAETAIRFAEIRDARGLAYAARCTSAAVLSAVELIDEVRPSRQRQGGRPA